MIEVVHGDRWLIYRVINNLRNLIHEKNSFERKPLSEHKCELHTWMAADYPLSRVVFGTLRFWMAGMVWQAKLNNYTDYSQVWANCDLSKYGVLDDLIVWWSFTINMDISARATIPRSTGRKLRWLLWNWSTKLRGGKFRCSFRAVIWLKSWALVPVVYGT